MKNKSPLKLILLLFLLIGFQSQALAATRTYYYDDPYYDATLNAYVQNYRWVENEPLIYSTNTAAYYQNNRSAVQEINQITDLDGNSISGYQNLSNTYYSNNQCYDSYNHTYYNCNNNTSTTSNQCYDSYNHTYYNCNNNTSTSNQCYDSYNHTYYNCNNNTSTSNQCYDSYNHTYYNCSNSSNVSTQKVVYIQNNTLLPSTVTISRGSSIKWVNRDSRSHRIIGNFTSYKIDSGLLYQNYTYTKVFSTAGTYKYHDQSNSNIKGTIIVTN